jgi:predicted peptidase
MMRAVTGTLACVSVLAVAGCMEPGDERQPQDEGKPDMIKVGFLDESVQMPDGAMRRYVVFVPHGYTPDRKWPAILFLHGAGERGDDNRGQVRVGIARAIRQRESTFGFITILPQCAAPPAWWTKQCEKDYAMAALAKTRKEYNVDDERIYLTGLSMGGFGTWALAADHPDTWAAIVPICGRGDPKTVAKFVHLPCWCFQGGADFVVRPRNSRDMIEALRKAGGKPRYTEYKGVGHNSWDKAYGTDELYTWLLAQRRKPTGR